MTMGEQSEDLQYFSKFQKKKTTTIKRQEEDELVQGK
jgi:hypothetical protein